MPGQLPVCPMHACPPEAWPWECQEAWWSSDPSSRSLPGTGGKEGLSSLVYPGLRPVSVHKCPGAALFLRSQVHDRVPRAHLVQKEPHCPGGIAEG